MLFQANWFHHNLLWIGLALTVVGTISVIRKWRLFSDPYEDSLLFKCYIYPFMLLTIGGSIAFIVALPLVIADNLISNQPQYFNEDDFNKMVSSCSHGDSCMMSMDVLAHDFTQVQEPTKIYGTNQLGGSTAFRIISYNKNKVFIETIRDNGIYAVHKNVLLHIWGETYINYGDLPYQNAGDTNRTRLPISRDDQVKFVESDLNRY